MYFAHLTGPPESTRYSDNYIDLEPGETRELQLHDPLHTIAPDELELGWAR